jgi:hypothetical protein
MDQKFFCIYDFFVYVALLPTINSLFALFQLCESLLFQKALASYIKKYAYSNAKTEDLWAVLEEETGEPVKDLMTTWTKQQGYPVIFAKLNGQYLELEQVSRQFFFIYILLFTYMDN